MTMMKFSTGDTIDWNATGMEQIKNNVLNILRTRMGEVPYMPTLGIRFDYVDSPLTGAQASLVAEIRRQISQWEPSAMLDSLQIVPSEDGNYQIEVVISL